MVSAIIEQLDTFGPDHCERLNYDQAIQYTRQLAKTHSENFTVVSWLLPRRLRDDFRTLYAFCRWADDLGDEAGDPERSVQLLAWWRQELQDCYDGEPRHPVFVALRPVINKHDLPRRPFDDLIDAFVQDQRVHRYGRWDEVLDYCARSANPVGRLVLYLCGDRDDHHQELSDSTCTGLQLANFWQDVRRDILEHDRVYIPSDVASRHGLDVETMVKAVQFDAQEPSSDACCRATRSAVGLRAMRPAFQNTMRELVSRTWPMFEKGRTLWPLVDPNVRVDVELFTRGGEAILRMIERQAHDTLRNRPRLTRGRKLSLMLGAATRKLILGVGP